MKTPAKTIKKTAYIVVESESGYDVYTASSFGHPYVYFSLDEAKQKLADIVYDWRDGFDEDDQIKIGTNDGDKWATIRYDEDGMLAWEEREGRTYTARIYTKEIEIPIAPELTELANAALAYDEAVDAEMESGDYHINDMTTTDEEIEEHNENVNRACETGRKLRELAAKYAA